MPKSSKTSVGTDASKKKTPRKKPSERLGGGERLTVLLEESEKFCEGVGLHKDLIRGS
jgi:hypothetical protein